MRFRPPTCRYALLGALSLNAVVAAQARAADPAPPPPPATGGAPIADIVVTATKRSSTAQSTPIAMSVLSGQDLANKQQVNAEALAQSLPSFHFGQAEGMAQISIRGIGFDNITVGGEARVAYHLDGIYLSRPDNVLGTMFDVSRVEVLRGPQGTLYGRNSTAGAINVITNDPTDVLSGFGSLTVGSYNLVKAEGAISGPLAEGLSFRIAGESVDRSGYGQNTTTGGEAGNDHEKAVRAKLKYDAPDQSFGFVLAGDYLHEHDHSVVDHYVGAGGVDPDGNTVVPTAIVDGAQLPPANKPYDIAQNFNPQFKRTVYGTSLTAHADLGPYKIVSLTAYRHSQYNWYSDLDATNDPISSIEIFERAEQESQEFRVSRDFSHLKVDIGGYFFHEKIFGFTKIPLDRAVLGLPSLIAQGYWAGGGISTTAYAGFFNADWNPLPNVDLIVGGRYSYEKKKINEAYEFDLETPYSSSNPVVPSATNAYEKSWNSFNPRVTLEYRPAQGVYTYATFSTGFKSGGFNLGGLQPPFAPEKLTDYEIGIKADWFGGRLRTNLSAFYYDYNNLQVTKIQGALVQIVNAASATLKGVEGDIAFSPSEPWLFTAAGSYLSSRYKRFSTADASRPSLGDLNLAGNELTQAPPYKISLSGQYTWHVFDGSLAFRGEFNRTGKVYFTPFDRAITAQAANSKGNLYLTFTDAEKKWTLGAYVLNVANVVSFSNKVIDTSLIGSPVVGAIEPPRTFGVTISRKF